MGCLLRTPLLTSGNTVENFALFPIKIVTKEAGVDIQLDKPTIINRNDVSKESLLPNLIGLNIYTKLIENGITIDSIFTPSGYQDVHSRVSFKNEMKALTELVNTRQETLSTYIINSFGEYIFNRHTGNPNSGEVTISSREPINGIIHTHYNGLLPVFSLSDIFTPYELHRRGNIKDLNGFSVGLITKSGTVFMFLGAGYLNWAENNIGNMNALKLIYDQYKINETTPYNKAIGNLLKLNKALNSNIILMEKGTKGYKRLEIDNENKVNRKNCND